MDSAYKMCGMTAEAGPPPSVMPAPQSSFPPSFSGNPGFCSLGFSGAQDAEVDASAGQPFALAPRYDGTHAGLL